MRVIPGNGPGEERFEPEARLLGLAATCVREADTRHVLQSAVDGISAILDVGCIAVVLTPADGTVGIAAQADADANFAARVNARRIPLSSDALISPAILGATWLVHRDADATQNSPVLAEHPERSAFSSVAAVPLIGATGTIGAFVMYALRDTAFAARHMDAIMSMASIVAWDLARREQQQAEAARADEAGTMLADVASLEEDLSESGVLERIAGYLRSLSTAPVAVAWRLQGNRFVAQAVFGDAAATGFTRTFIANADANMPIGQGPLGRAARSGDTVIVKDTLADRSFGPWVDVAQTYRLRSVLALPLLADPRATIVLELYAHEADAFSEPTIAKIEAFAPHARVALRNALDADALRSLARDRALAIAAASGISRGLEEAEVVRSIARAGVEALGASFGIAYVGDVKGLQVAGGWNAPAELSARLAVNPSDPAYAAHPAVQALREARYASRANVTTDSAWIRLGWEQLAREHGFNAVSAFPLLSGGKPIGAIALFYPERLPALESEEEIVRQLGTQGGAAIDAARRYEQARSARNFLDRILEESNDAIVQIDLRGLVVSWNKGAERIFGIARDEAVGRSFHELPIIPVERGDDIRELLSRVGRGEQVHVFEVDAVGRDGKRMEVLLSASPARDHRGDIIGLVAFSKDISEQKKQLQQLARQNRTLVIMRDVVRSLSREVGLGDISGKGLEKLLEVLHLDAGRLYLYEPASGRLDSVAQRGFTPEGTAPIDVTPSAAGDEGPLASAVAYHQTMLTSDGANVLLEHPHFAHRSADAVSAVLTKPLTIGEEIIGAVQVVGFDGRQISSEDQAIFHAVTDELAVALRHARMLEESARMAITDPLTGLYNYRFTQDVLRKRLSEARRRKRPLAVVMVDVDGLHGINESHGREFGDQVLHQFGQVLAGTVRISDIVARYGGDEFIVLLPETQLSDAVMLAERMGAKLADAEWPHDGELSVTASIGVAAFPEAGTQMQMLLKAADAALFRAKQAGRNTVYPRLDTLPRFAG
ncbi:MAG: diguanylate cyclase [Candidatus Eremiobacteraeota bacterium]|nr:diguanylate cyclase [Candidatus Eremiobacteraeota bacterium]